MDPALDADPQINNNPQLQGYYHSLESRLGYRLVLGGTRHFGFYDHDTWWPFPIGRALRAMEDKVAASLDLPQGAQVLDAGCGVGHVAIHLATKHGLRVQGIDVVEHHLTKARRNIAQEGLSSNQVSVRKMDYHHIEGLGAETLDGIYTTETFVHATDPDAVLAGFFRALRPGGRVSLFEYDHTITITNDDDVDGLNNSQPGRVASDMRKINEFSAMPTNSRSHPGVFKRMLENAGFTDVVVRDYSENIMPMIRLFHVLAFVPYWLVSLLGLERYFINTVAGYALYRDRKYLRYVNVLATKPGGPIEVHKGR
ncbi:S-adenosyl-L-methionine-dependent methyltransferase [Aspergillus pseudoustus]|uniref:S-adenosyl-L-methionine-dependent methyltransferase n=1 Tax=Aspergillus pseudoustus TaxID=1810923 RepID=A0ABR4IUC3_9EURO